MRELYPPIEPYKEGTLHVSDLHQIYYQEAGNPEGKPVLFLHGGPGGGIVPVYRQYLPAGSRAQREDNTIGSCK